MYLSNVGCWEQYIGRILILFNFIVNFLNYCVTFLPPYIRELLFPSLFHKALTTWDIYRVNSNALHCRIPKALWFCFSSVSLWARSPCKPQFSLAVPNPGTSTLLFFDTHYIPYNFFALKKLDGHIMLLQSASQPPYHLAITGYCGGFFWLHTPVGILALIGQTLPTKHGDHRSPFETHDTSMEEKRANVSLIHMYVWKLQYSLTSETG